MVNNRDLFARYSFADESGECRGLFAIEVGFESVSNGFVEQNPRPSRTEHDFHFSSGRLARIKLDDRLSRRLLGEIFGSSLRLEVLDAHTATTPGIAPRGIRTIFGDTEHAHARQGLRVGCDNAVRTDNQNSAQLIGIAGTNLHNARVIAPSVAVSTLKEFDFCRDLRVDGWRCHSVESVASGGS